MSEHVLYEYDVKIDLLDALSHGIDSMILNITAPLLERKQLFRYLIVERMEGTEAAKDFVVRTFKTDADMEAWREEKGISFPKNSESEDGKYFLLTMVETMLIHMKAEMEMRRKND